MEEEKITLTLESPAVEEEKEEVKEEEVKVTVDAAKLDDSGLRDLKRNCYQRILIIRKYLVFV